VPLTHNSLVAVSKSARSTIPKGAISMNTCPRIPPLGRVPHQPFAKRGSSGRFVSCFAAISCHKDDM
jgi:hypothetical protein